MESCDIWLVNESPSGVHLIWTPKRQSTSRPNKLTGVFSEINIGIFTVLPFTLIVIGAEKGIICICPENPIVLATLPMLDRGMCRASSADTQVYVAPVSIITLTDLPSIKT